MDESKLERLVIDNAAFDELDAAMNVFCPFQAVGMSRQEVRHGFFLEHILDPVRAHGFGAECLTAFMRAVASTLADSTAGIAPLDVHLMDLDSATVRREYQSIDLLIEVPQEKLVVAVELKIDASEHSGQLGRYRRVVEREWPDHRRLLLFLTKRGDSPSEADGAGWHGLPLAPVADALAGVAKRQVGEAAARMMLSAYVAMLRRDHLTDDRLEQLAVGLWREHRDALEFLMERRPNVEYGLLGTLAARRGEAANRLSADTGLRIVPAHSTKSAVRFAVADWDHVPGMLSGPISWKPSPQMLLLEVLRGPGGGAKIQFTLGTGEARQQLFDLLREEGAEIGGNWGIQNKTRQLANAAFALPDEQSDEESLERLVAAIAAFITKHRTSYEAALARLTDVRQADAPA